MQLVSNNSKTSDVKTKYALAAAQMALASALVWWDNALQIAQHYGLHLCDSPGPTPVHPVLLSINAPLVVPQAMWEALPRAIWGTFLPYYWSVGIMIAAVGLFWYWVGMNVQAWRARRTILMCSWRPARFFFDAVLILSGVICGLFGVGTARAVVLYWPQELHMGCYTPLWSYTLSSSVVALALLCWCLVLVFFYGRDFVLAVGRR